MTVLLSKTGVQVVKMCGLSNVLAEISPKPQVEVDSNKPFLVRPLQETVYRFLVVMPVMAYGIAKIVIGLLIRWSRAA